MQIPGSKGKEKNVVFMVAEIAIYLDVRRAKKNNLYPVKLKVYYDGQPYTLPFLIYPKMNFWN